MKNIILIFILATTAPSWAKVSCSAFVQTQTSSSPTARFNFSNGTNKSTATITREKTFLNLDFTRKFLTGLSSFFTNSSTTTTRVEERAVIRAQESEKIISESGLKWKPRDVKKDGEDFTTITTYSSKFIMETESGVKASAKLRSRKYYSHETGHHQAANMKSVYGDIGSLEIKVSNIVGMDSDGVKTSPGSVFKPRIFISDATVERISKLTLSKLKKDATQSAFVEEIHALKDQDKLLNPNKDEVAQFVKSLVLLLEQNPNLFEVQTVIAYNRDSFSANTENGLEYQYTVDRNVRIYEPDHRIKVAGLSGYLDKDPMIKVDDDVAYAELKSPLVEQTENTPDYQRMSQILFSRHLSAFESGKGKHSLATRTRNFIAQTDLSEKLHTEGLYFFIVKGFGNLPTQPNKKTYKENKEWSVAMPLILNNDEHRLILGYRSNTVKDKTRFLLRSIEMVDSFDRKINLDSNAVKHILNTALLKEDYTTITIDNQSLTFPGIVNPETTEKLSDFFSRFFRSFLKEEDTLRDITSLYGINNALQLRAYERRMNIVNKLNKWKDRFQKVGMQIVISSALLVGYAYITDLPDTISGFFNRNSGEPFNVQVLSEDEVLQLRGELNQSGSFEVSPIEGEETFRPDVTIDLDFELGNDDESDFNGDDF